MDRRGLFKRLGVAAVAVAVGASAAPQVEAEAEPTITVDTHTYVARTAAPELTFDDLVADCKARGCHLESAYSVERLRYEIAHWLDGETWVDDTMTARTRDMEPVAAWLDGLHERSDRIHSEELGAAMDEITTKPGGEMLTADDYLRVRAMFRDMTDPA